MHSYLELQGVKVSMVDYPDGTLPVMVRVEAELLAQMRSLPWWVRYAPRRILYLDDFEGVLKWFQGTGTVKKESGLDTFEGSNHLSIATDAIDGAFANTGIILGGVPPSKFALQLRWHCTKTSPALRWFRSEVHVFDGEYGYYAEILYYKYCLAAEMNKWQYMDETSGYTDIPNGSENVDITQLMHQYLYLTVDLSLDTPVYSRLVTSKLDLDLSTLKCYKFVDATAPRIELNLYCATDTNAIAEVCVDTLCLSDEEI